jgi:hypothetical protein
MKISIKNFRGLKTALIELSKLTILCGPNGAGKSSACHALASALSGQTIPLDGVRKNEAGLLVHSGAGKGSIDVEVEGGSISVSYPQAKLTTEGKPPHASAYAVGLKSLVGLDQKSASNVLIDYLKALPTEEDLRASDLPLNDEQIAKLWKRIDELGWDGAFQSAREHGIAFKAQWETITGERYGSSKAENWLPAEWLSDLAGASEESLTAMLTQAREFLEAAISTAAVDQSERNALKAEADKLPTIVSELTKAQRELEGTTAALKSLQDKHRELPKPAAEEKAIPCPHCKGPLVIRGSQIVAQTPVNAEENAKRKEAIDASTEAGKAAAAIVKIAQTDVEKLQAQRHHAMACAEKLDKMPVDGGTTAAQLEQAREETARAERSLRAFKAKRDADAKHTAATQNAAVQALLAPDGLRLKKLRDAIRSFNERLAQLCAVAGWGVVAVGDDLQITYGDRPLVMLSQSEVFRVRVVLQVAMTLIDGSAAVVVDAADVLDKGGRNGLVRLLISTERPALVAMTMAREDVPRMGSLGSSYWIEGGTSHEQRAE